MTVVERTMARSVALTQARLTCPGETDSPRRDLQ